MTATHPKTRETALPVEIVDLAEVYTDQRIELAISGPAPAART